MAGANLLLDWVACPKRDTRANTLTGRIAPFNGGACEMAVLLGQLREVHPRPEVCEDSLKTSFLSEPHRVIFPDYSRDSAGILFQVSELQFPDPPIPLRPIDSPISIGVEVGWLGFPVIEPFTLCFFAGPISARQDESKAYLIDGVASPGVSGGPVLFSSDTDGVQFVGVVSAYHSSRSRGETMPGLLVAQDVSHFHGVVQKIRSWDEAKRKKAEMEKLQPKDPPLVSPK